MSARFVLNALRGSAPSYKVALMLSLSGEPFDYEHVDLRSGAHKQPAYLEKNRYGQVPCLEDRSNGFALCQAPAILEYLSDALGTFGGRTALDRARIREWMFWEFDRLMKGVFRPRAVAMGFWNLSDEITQHYRAEGVQAMELMEGHLAGRDWFVGEAPTIADIDLYGVIFHATQGNHDLSPFMNLRAFMARVEALPGYGTPSDLQPLESRKAA